MLLPPETQFNPWMVSGCPKLEGPSSAADRWAQRREGLHSVEVESERTGRRYGEVRPCRGLFCALAALASMLFRGLQIDLSVLGE